MEGKSLDYELASGIGYLNACINENLRMNGPVLMQTRVCTKDTEVPDAKALTQPTTHR